MKFKFRRYYLYYLARLAAYKIYILPISIGLYIGKILGALAFWVLFKYRDIAISNLELAFSGEKSKPEIRRIAKQVFENLGKTAVEVINFPKLNKKNIDKFVRIVNLDIVDKAFEKGKGVIILTAHFGNWELLALTMRVKGYPGAAIGKRLYFDKYDKYLNSLRKVHDLNIIYRDDSPKKILKILRDNQIIGILADQDVDSVEGVFVDFFGHPAYTPIGPVALAKASGATIVPAFMIREKGRHTLVMENPIELIDTGDKEADMIRNTQAWSRIVESYIRRYPEQWVWLHRRWKTREKPSK